MKNLYKKLLNRLKILKVNTGHSINKEDVFDEFEKIWERKIILDQVDFGNITLHRFRDIESPAYAYFFLFNLNGNSYIATTELCDSILENIELTIQQKRAIEEYRQDLLSLPSDTYKRLLRRLERACGCL